MPQPMNATRSFLFPDFFTAAIEKLLGGRQRRARPALPGSGENERGIMGTAGPDRKDASFFHGSDKAIADQS
jgi:hypothetical protein